MPLLPDKINRGITPKEKVVKTEAKCPALKFENLTILSREIS